MNPPAAVRRQPTEISVQARLFPGGRYRGIGHLVPYRSALWTIKGVYLVSTRSGQSELYYILSETAPAFDHGG